MEKAKILVVEDNRIVAEDIKNNLEEMGYAVCAIATTGEKALSCVEAELPDIAIMDIRLGKGMNGIEAATHLHQDHQVPIIYLTAYSDAETLARAKMTEPYAYLVKPFEARELQSALEIALYKHDIERKVRESRKWLQTTLTSIGDGVVATDEKGCVKFINPVAEQLTGWSQAEAIGLPLENVFHIVNEQTREIVDNPVKKVLETGRIVGLANHTILISRDGREIPIKDSGAPIILGQGEMIGVVLVFQDGTQSRVVENRLRQSKERLQLAMESAKEGLWEMDLTNGDIYFDDFCFKMLGFKPQAAAGNHRKWLMTHLHPDDRDQVLHTLDGINDNPKGLVNLDYRLARHDGSYLWVNSKAKAIANGKNDAPLIVGIQRDISERKANEEKRRQLEFQLRQSHKMEAIGTLAGGIAHDFNNILASIIGYTELSIDDTEKGTVLHENLEEIMVAGLRARDLVRQILMFSRQAEFELKPIELNSLIKEAIKLMRATLPSYVDIVEEIESNAIVVTANATQLHQILVNLCTNAFHALDGGQGIIKIRLDTIQFTEDKEIQYSAIVAGDYARLMVTDNGKGIDSRDLDMIFDPYFTTKDKDKGTGLGLSIVHGIVKSHHGHIIVDSLLGRGTTFSIYLPLSSKEIIEVTPHTMAGEEVRGSEQILFVDDEHAITKVQKRNLERMGYKVDVMTSARDALAAFENQPHRYDLVITDMAMPEMSGDALSNRIKAIRPDIKVILCTGYNEKIDRHTVAQLGIDGYLIKPVKNKTMAQSIREVLDGKKSESTSG